MSTANHHMPFEMPASRPRIVQANRRASPRIPVDELLWLRGAQLTSGGSVSLIDLSIGGASFEAGSRLQAGDATELELVAARERTVASGRIVRSQLIELRPDSVRYRSACVFDKPLPWQDRLRGAADRKPMLLQADDAFEAWAGWSEILLVFRHGRRLQGYTRAFGGRQSTIEVWPSRTAAAHQRQVIPLALLREISVIRDFGGDGTSVAPAPQIARTHVEIVFKNGGTVRGVTPGYDQDGPGLWLLSDGSLNALRVFAISSAVAEIRVS